MRLYWFMAISRKQDLQYSHMHVGLQFTKRLEKFQNIHAVTGEKVDKIETKNRTNKISLKIINCIVPYTSEDSKFICHVIVT